MDRNDARTYERVIGVYCGFFNQNNNVITEPDR